MQLLHVEKRYVPDPKRQVRALVILLERQVVPLVNVEATKGVARDDALVPHTTAGHATGEGMAERCERVEGAERRSLLEVVGAWKAAR